MSCWPGTISSLCEFMTQNGSISCRLILAVKEIVAVKAAVTDSAQTFGLPLFFCSFQSEFLPNGLHKDILWHFSAAFWASMIIVAFHQPPYPNKKGFHRGYFSWTKTSPASAKQQPGTNLMLTSRSFDGLCPLAVLENSPGRWFCHSGATRRRPLLRPLRPAKLAHDQRNHMDGQIMER